MALTKPTRKIYRASTDIYYGQQIGMLYAGQSVELDANNATTQALLRAGKLAAVEAE